MRTRRSPKQNHLLAALPVCECYAVVRRESDRLLIPETALTP
jgi:hypothetical protein